MSSRRRCVWRYGTERSAGHGKCNRYNDYPYPGTLLSAEGVPSTVDRSLHTRTLGRFNGCLVSSAVSYEVHIQEFKQHRMDNLARKEQVEFDNKAA